MKFASLPDGNLVRQGQGVEHDSKLGGQHKHMRAGTVRCSRVGTWCSEGHVTQRGGTWCSTTNLSAASSFFSYHFCIVAPLCHDAVRACVPFLHSVQQMQPWWAQLQQTRGATPPKLHEVPLRRHTHTRTHAQRCTLTSTHSCARTRIHMHARCISVLPLTWATTCMPFSYVKAHESDMEPYS